MEENLLKLIKEQSALATNQANLTKELHRLEQEIRAQVETGRNRVILVEAAHSALRDKIAQVERTSEKNDALHHQTLKMVEEEYLEEFHKARVMATQFAGALQKVRDEFDGVINSQSVKISELSDEVKILTRTVEGLRLNHFLKDFFRHLDPKIASLVIIAASSAVGLMSLTWILRFFR